MQYTDWIKPRPFQDDPGFIGKTFAAQNKTFGLEERMCILATEIWIDRQTQLGRRSDSNQKTVLDTDELWFGKRKVLYRIRMPDNSVWVARLHNTLYSKTAIMDHTTRTANQVLLFESEVATMQFVKENTKIPVPEVYGYDPSTTNVLGTPYIFMECIAGQPYPFPFSKERHIKDEDLTKIHSQLTDFAWQLWNKPFDTIGQLRFAADKRGGVVIGPIVDRKERLYGPFASSRAFYKERAKRVYETEKRRRVLGEGFHVDDSLESAALHVMAAEHAGKQCFDSGPFVLQHADLHWQNLLFDEHCTIVGVIDWEWTQTVPVDSFNLLPFNFATKMLPYRKDVVERHENHSIQHFNTLSDTGSTADRLNAIKAMTSFQNSQSQCLARYMEQYNWPEIRRKHFDHLKRLVESMGSSQS
ncbi:hypothetical protein CC77DRAFT_295144 [Alternaria alternata]|uniref:Aminoglycoside phosphotransferase domain-containing protein n=1 Tax=Alternaria alternata TaxID=5599 RepID=A0A177DZN9_ALTAL|nr:hypothetical protein CC77DRAFT_295144 [Alternaria alternata]OAG24958.1 hypothetical protein CC77DRAFT_295144 [Alternaria alternata]RYN53553.1 hypothetical protein AA0118_g9609 [Alternaria tenuissima]